MTAPDDKPVLVVIHLVGGNDCLNTVVPYGDPRYYDHRPTVNIPEAQVLPIDDRFGLHPGMAKLKEIYDQGKVTIVTGIGYRDQSYSHFRSCDIWETGSPETFSRSGWLAKVLLEIDPRGSNPIGAVNLGVRLPTALSISRGPATSVASLDSVGYYSTGVADGDREPALDAVRDICTSPVRQLSTVMAHTRTVGQAVLSGTALLRSALPVEVSAEYPATPIGRALAQIARIDAAGLGTRIFYASHGSFDLHSQQLNAHSDRLRELSDAVAAFYHDAHARRRSSGISILVWSEFGRRVTDNGSGTDHGAGGMAMLIGDGVRGGFYGEYPSLKRSALVEGNLDFTVDFRSVYAAVMERWLEVDSRAVLGRRFEPASVI